jgi:hypothetical protein
MNAERRRGSDLSSVSRARLDQKLNRFFTTDFDAVRESTLASTQIAALPQSSASFRQGGVETRGRWEYRCAKKLAQDLGRDLIELPGGHNGLVSHPRAFAAELQRLLDEV